MIVLLVAAGRWRPGTLFTTLQGPERPVTKRDPACSIHSAWAENPLCGLCWQDPLIVDQHPFGADGYEAGHGPRDTSQVPDLRPDASPLSPFPGRCGEPHLGPSLRRMGTPPGNVSGPPPPPGFLQSLRPPDPRPGRQRRAPLRPGWRDHLLQEQCLRAPPGGAAGAGGAPPR